MRSTFYIFLSIIFIVSCKSDPDKTDTIGETPVQKQESPITIIENPVSGNSSLPRLHAGRDTLYMSWVEKEDSLARLLFSTFHDDTWSPSTEIISGSDWFVNWADFPVIASNNGNLLTNFLQKSASGTYTYDVKLNLYSEEKKAWKKDFILHTDGTKSEHGFVSMVPYGESGFFVSWLDGRNTAGASHSHEHGGAMTLRTALVTADGSITAESLLDDKVCDCCGTSMAITSKGPVVVYRDRSDEEIRDISIVRWEKDNWTPPQTIGKDNWKIPGCPVNGPAVDAMGEIVAVAWFTASEGEGAVKVSFSQDNGKSFGLPSRIDAGNATGRVDIVLLSEKEAAVLWMEPEGELDVIRLMKIDIEGNSKPPVSISKISAERASGFPQLERSGNRLYIAWTVKEEGQVTINTAFLQIDSL